MRRFSVPSIWPSKHVCLFTACGGGARRKAWTSQCTELSRESLLHRTVWAPLTPRDQGLLTSPHHGSYFQNPNLGSSLSAGGSSASLTNALSRLFDQYRGAVI